MHEERRLENKDRRVPRSWRRRHGCCDRHQPRANGVDVLVGSLDETEAVGAMTHGEGANGES